MKVRYSATAAADLGDILDYLTERNPRAAAKIGATIEATADRIAVYPESSPITDEPPVRMTPVGRYPYLIIYIVERDEVLIVRVLHGARLRPWESGE